MRKIELIHLHSLLSLVRARVEGRYALPDDAFSEYDALAIAPMAITEPKDRHRAAVLALARELAAVLDAAAEVEEVGKSDPGDGVVEPDSPVG